MLTRPGMEGPPGLSNAGDLGSWEQVSLDFPEFPWGTAPSPCCSPPRVTGTNNESASHRVTQIPGDLAPRTQPQPRPACPHLQGARLLPLLP